MSQCHRDKSADSGYKNLFSSSIVINNNISQINSQLEENNNENNNESQKKKPAPEVHEELNTSSLIDSKQTPQGGLEDAGQEQTPLLPSKKNAESA